MSAAAQTAPQPVQEVLPPTSGKHHIRAALRGGYWWHTFRVGERTIVLDRIGKAGDCLRF